MIDDDIRAIYPEGLRIAQATVNLADMGESSIAVTLDIDGDAPTDFSRDWELEFRGQRYIMPLRQPQCSKESGRFAASAELTFRHRAYHELSREFFTTMQPIDTGTAIPDKYEASVSLNLHDFIDLVAQVLAYYYGDAITIDLNPDWAAKSEPTVVEISYSKVWDVILALYDTYGVRWHIAPGSDPLHYVIRVGYPAPQIDHIFSYGFEGGLLKVERQVQDEKIANKILGRGGDKNLPLRYFKKHDPDNASFSPDPDWIPELANIYFSELRGATFRSYIQGWRAAHVKEYRERYPDEDWTLTVEKAGDAYSPWAWMRGFTDSRFDPVEFVADGYTTEAGGYAVAYGSSIDRYGPFIDALDPDEKVYPTIQGIDLRGDIGRIDELVAVERVVSDDIAQAVEAEAVVRDFDYRYNTETFQPQQVGTIRVYVGEITLRAGETATVSTLELDYSARGYHTGTDMGPYVAIGGTNAVIKDEDGNELPSGAGVSGAGTYTLWVDFHVANAHDTQPIIIIVAVNSTKVIIGGSSKRSWKSTFDVWVKNIWGIEQLPGESDTAYASRVWRPILGDREGDEAKVVFADGPLSLSEDYQFVITAIPTCERRLCEWETLENGKLVKRSFTSEWRITLAKSDADMESLGVYQPSVERQAVAGDHFYFIGIDMPHLYVVKAEELLDDRKKDRLREVADIKPTWVVTADRVRMSNHGLAGALIDSIVPGNVLRLADPRFIPGAAYETLYVQSVTITYRQPSDSDPALNPDVEFVLSDDYATTGNPIERISGEVSVLSRQVGAISNVEQIVRAIGDKLYLRKDGIKELSSSPTAFASLITSHDFRPGMVGGRGWGLYQDAQGRWCLEVDNAFVRSDMNVNTVVINQVKGSGGITVESAAAMEVTEVTEADGVYRCYFDTKYGSVGNLFREGDVAYSSRFDADNNALRYYKRRVMAVGPDYVDLLHEDAPVDLSWPDSGIDGDDAPLAGDAIVQYGSYTDPDRRYVIVRDVSGGGYERFIEGLDSVFASGREYFFVGRQSGLYGGRPRFFLGDDNGYISYENGVFKIKAVLSVDSTIGDKPIGEYVAGEAVKSVGYTMESSNDMAGIAADALGVITGHYPSVRMRVWHGREDVTARAALTIAEVSPAGGVQARVSSSGVVSLGALTADVATVTVAALIDGVSLDREITVYKVKPGAPGQDGVTIKYTSVTYAATMASAQPADSAFIHTSIAEAGVTPGAFLWSKSTVTYTDGASVSSYAVSRIGTDGDDGLPGTNGVNGKTAYTHWAYADSSDGKTNFNTSYYSGALYFGICSDYSPTDPADPSKYEWARFKGDNGTSIEIRSQSVRYSTSHSRLRPDDSTFTLTEVPTLDEGDYLWSMTVVTYSDNSSTKSYAVSRIGESPVVYYLEVTPDNISRDANGVLSSDRIVAVKRRLKGDVRTVTRDKVITVREVFADGSESESVLLGSGQQVSAPYDIPATLRSVTFVMYDDDGTTVLDSQRVPVLDDASGLIVSGENLLVNSGRWYNEVDGQPPRHWGWLNNQPSTSYLDGKLRIVHSATSGWSGVRSTVPITVPPGAQVRIIAKFSVTGLSSSAPFVRFGLAHPWDAYMVASSHGNGDFTVSDVYTNGTQFSEWYVMFNTSDGFDGMVSLEYFGVFLGNAEQAWVPSPRDRYDYLSAALGDAQLGSTQVDGGLILTSAIKAGYENAAGERVVMSGMNGVLTSEAAPALWAGGDGSDLDAGAASRAASRPAQWLVRMDGTGYMAGNTLRFRKAALGVGPSAQSDDTIVLDATGLHMINTNGFERLMVADEAVPDDIFMAVSPEHQVSASNVALGSVSVIAAGARPTPRYEGNLTHELASKAPTTPVRANYYVSTGPRKFVTLTGLTSGARVRATLSVNFSNFTYDSSIWLGLGGAVEFTIYIAVDGTVIAQSTLSGSGGSVTADFYHSGDSDSLAVEVGVMGTEVFGQWYNVGQSQSVASYALSASNRYDSKTIIGNNGLASMWGNAMLLVNASGVTMRHGGFGLRVTGAGIQYNKKGTADGWQTLV